MTGFGRWQRVADVAVPVGPGLLQVRNGQGATGVIDYPRGKTAMLYYAADDLRVADALDRLRARLPAKELAALSVRFAPANLRSAPTEALAASLRQFVARFGALPLLNQDDPAAMAKL